VAHYNVGFLLYQKGNKKLASEHFAQSAAADPNFAPARDWVARLSAEEGAPVQTQIAASGEAVRQSYISDPRTNQSGGGYEPYYRNQLRREAGDVRVTEASYPGSTYPSAPPVSTPMPNAAPVDFTEDRIATSPRPLPPVDSNEGPPTQR
jgi:hypothetical protein